MIKRLFSVSLAVLMAAFMMGLNSAVYAYQLSKDTPILIQSDAEISEATNKTGDIVNFHVVNQVKDNRGNVVLYSDAPVQATILRLEQKKRIGRPAELSISCFTANLNDGKPIALEGRIDQKSVSRMGRSIALGAAVFPLFLLMKGAPVVLPAGTQTTVYPAVVPGT